MMIKTFLFPRQVSDKRLSLLLLALRLLFGLLLMSHGWGKLSHYAELSASFPDPFGIGSPASLGLAIFGELVCAAAFVLGFLYRLAMLPMIVTMGVAFFFAQGGRIAEGELAFVYLLVFVLIYWTGPGRYAVDTFLARWLDKG